MLRVLKLLPEAATVKAHPEKQNQQERDTEIYGTGQASLKPVWEEGRLSREAGWKTWNFFQELALQSIGKMSSFLVKPQFCF